MPSTSPVPPRTISVAQSTSALSYLAIKSQDSEKLHDNVPLSSSALIDAIRMRQRANRETVLKRDLSFSLVRFFIGMISLVLVFSDILRSGLGMKQLPASYPPLEPDEVVGFGSSWNYSVLALTKEEAANDSTAARVWSYKFDSTSITWRAFAHYYALPTFPECLLYQSSCPSEHFSGSVAFEMIDTLVQAIADRGSKQARLEQGSQRRSGPIAVSLRTESKYLDRLHHYLLPNVFVSTNWRTNQALYYSPELLAASDARSICFPPNGSKARSPRFCQEFWTNFQRSCGPGDAACQDVGLLYVHSMQRLREVQARFPNTKIDLTFLESQEDLQVSRGGIGAVGNRRSDVTVVIRSRKCNVGSTPTCETVYVDDYRYETGIMIADVAQWYKVVAALRTIGQSYFYLRAFALVLACYHVYDTPTAQEHGPIWNRIQKALLLFMKMPMQCVVYGSPFPVICYVLAHLIDSPVAYQDLERQSISQGGVLNLKLEQFISYAFIQMRNVWIYSLAWHMTVVAMTSQRWANCRHLREGILGVPEFLISTFSSVTLFAQFRSTIFRPTKILSVDEIPSTTALSWCTIKYQNSFAHRGRGSVLLGGVIIDLKFLMCTVVLVVLVGGLRLVVLRLRYLNRKRRNYSRLVFLAPTPVPYSAGILWPTVSMCVYWTSDFFCVHEQQLSYPMPQSSSEKERQAVLPEAEANSNLDLQSSSIEGPRSRLQGCSHVFGMPSAQMGVKTFRFIQSQMRCLHGRTVNMEVNVAFMNLMLMSDPLVFLYTKLGGGEHTSKLAYYQCLLRPSQVVLLPEAVVSDHNECTRDLRLLRRVNASELAWADLVQCG